MAPYIPGVSLISLCSSLSCDLSEINCFSPIPINVKAFKVPDMYVGLGGKFPDYWHGRRKYSALERENLKASVFILKWEK